MEACGVGLSRPDMYGVMMVCKQLGEDPKLGVATVRFFGKVLQQYIPAYDLRSYIWICLLTHASPLELRARSLGWHYVLWFGACASCNMQCATSLAASCQLVFDIDSAAAWG